MKLTIKWNAEIGKAPKSEQMGVQILARSNIEHSGFKILGFKTKHSVSTIKAQMTEIRYNFLWTFHFQTEIIIQNPNCLKMG